MIKRGQNKKNAVILLYHGVTDSSSAGIENYSKKHITARDFSRQMNFIKRNNTVLSLYELIKHIQNGLPFPEYSVVVTFDDGFENNYTVALPILKKYGIPATFFLSVGFIGKRDLFWVDQLEHAVNMAKMPSVTVAIKSKKTAFDIRNNSKKIKFVNLIKKYFKSLSEDTRKKKLNEILKLLKADLGSAERVINYRKLTWDQVRKMSGSDLVSLGAHSMTHAKLSEITNRRLKDEIIGSKYILESRIGKKVDLFSYPEGQSADYSEEVIRVLKKSGYICSPSAICGYNSPSEDLFHLKRVFVGFMGAKFPLSLG